MLNPVLVHQENKFFGKTITLNMNSERTDWIEGSIGPHKPWMLVQASHGYDR